MGETWCRVGAVGAKVVHVVYQWLTDKLVQVGAKGGAKLVHNDINGLQGSWCSWCIKVLGEVVVVSAIWFGWLTALNEPFPRRAVGHFNAVHFDAAVREEALHGCLKFLDAIGSA